MRDDPIELQCLTEQMHAIVLTITDVAENHDTVVIDNNSLLVVYRIQHYTHWLKETCFNIHETTPTKDLVSDILAASEHIEGLTYVCLWQTQEMLNTHIKNALEAIANMASEAHTETVRLWGQP